jgi:molybdate transport system substrate-binding protein
MIRRWVACAVLVLGLAPRGATAAASRDQAPVRVLVAASFRDCLTALADTFTARTGQEFLISSGSTGGLYAQIRAGAPCHLFLAADTARPGRLVDEGWAAPADRRPYAIGQLVLCSSRVRPELAGADFAQALELVLQEPHAKLAMANPEVAPYGRAAGQVLERLGRTSASAAQLVTGQDVGQAWQFVHTGAADLGFVALSQVKAATPAPPAVPSFGIFLLSPDLYDPVRQEMVLSRTAPPQARAFADYLTGDEAVPILEAFGFARPGPP